MLLSQALRIHDRDIIALAGGGGKTTLMFRLAGELAGRGRRVVTSMTTRIYASQMALAPASLVAVPGHEEELLAQLPVLLAAYGHVLVAGATRLEADKVAGVPPELLGRIAELPEVENVVIEADGSRRLPFKAPAEHEPVIPAATTVVVPMVGLDVLGRRLEAGSVHRAERVAGLAGVALGAVVTPAIIARVLAHAQGGARNVPPGARLVPFLNKVEDAATLAAAREIARALLAEPRVDSVIIGALAQDDPVREVWGRTGAIVLAAGAASRFGALKQVLPWHGRPLVAHVAGQALACPDLTQTVVTVGAGAEQVQAALAGLGVAQVPVPDWAEGQSRSVQAGLASLADGAGGPLDAALFLLADQPGVSPALLSALIARHRETLAPVVAPRYEGRRGNPVLFDRRTFPAFRQLQGDVGARPIIQAHSAEIAWVDWPGAEIIQDIDTADDYRAMVG